MKTLYLECNMGAAGDMLMAALYELLEEGQKKQFLDGMNALNLPGVEISPVQTVACGISATHMAVKVHGHEEHGHQHSHHGHEHGPHHSGEAHHEHAHHDHGHHHTSPGHIGAIIDGLALPQQVRENARKVYDAIAQAEAQAHGCAVGDVHFHEVGALDAVADVVGVCYALHLLGPEAVFASPVHVGSGTVTCEHGVMPVPAPATAALLTGVPIYGGTIQGELCTPTGAALLKTFAQSFGPMPPMVTKKTGYGAGTKEFEQPNCVRAFWGESVQGANGEIIELVCSIDDMTPEALAFACARLLELGALDVYTTPGTMKKGRSGHVLTVLCNPEREKEMARHVLAQTTTNGLRVRRCGKYFLTPSTEQVQTQWGVLGIKLSQGYGVTHAKPEFEEVAALAQKNGLPYQAVFEDAIRQIKE